MNGTGAMDYDTKVAKLKEIIFEATCEQEIPARTKHYPTPDAPFDTRINQTYWRELLADVLMKTDALRILFDMVFGKEEDA